MRAVLLLALAGCASVQAAPVAESPLEGAIAHTILLDDPGCTGVRVGGGLVVTAAHCTDEKAIGDDYSGFKLEYQHATHDFSVLSGDAPISSVWMLDARPGEHLYIVGYPSSIDGDGQKLTITDGIYTGVEYNDMQRTTAHAYYGNSGGGAWSDEGGLLGILVEIRIDEGGVLPAHSYMVPIRYVRELLLTE